MVEVFKTNVKDCEQAEKLLDAIHGSFINHRANFDLEDCDKILQFDCSNLTALRIRGTVLRKLGQNNKAFADLEKVLSQEPDNAVALHERAAVYTALHRYQLALSDCEKIFSLKLRESISTF